MRKEDRNKYIFVGLGVVAFVIVILLIIFGGSGAGPTNNTQGSTNYSKTDQNRPKAVLSTTKIDWKEIKLEDTVDSIVDLKNDGSSALDITRMSTSCGCTSVKVIYPDGKETKEYSMHKTSDKVTIAPGASVKLKVTYRPYSMPIEGAVTRQVFLETNDPVNPQLTIDASAVVKK